jgi:hypothetical protein
MFDSEVSTGNINIHFHGFWLDKIMESLQILYAVLHEHGVGPPFDFNTAAVLLEIDSYKF